MARTSSLIIRKNHRFEVSLPSKMSIAPEFHHAVRLAGGDSSGTRWLDVDVVDLSSQGIGVMSQVFVPRGCRVHLKVFLPGVEAYENEPPLAEMFAVVRRVTMTDRRPAYLIGCLLKQEDTRSSEVVGEILEALEAGDAPSLPSIDQILRMREPARVAREATFGTGEAAPVDTASGTVPGSIRDA